MLEIFHIVYWRMDACLNCIGNLCYQAVADIIRTTLGPRSMLKMLLDAAGGNSSIYVVNIS